MNIYRYRYRSLALPDSLSPCSYRRGHGSAGALAHGDHAPARGRRSRPTQDFCSPQDCHSPQRPTQDCSRTSTSDPLPGGVSLAPNTEPGTLVRAKGG